MTLEPAQVIVSIVDLAVDGGGGFLKGWRSAEKTLELQLQISFLASLLPTSGCLKSMYRRSHPTCVSPASNNL